MPNRIEYAYALEYALSWLGDAAPPTLAVVSTPAFADCALSYCPAGLTLVCLDERTRAHAERRLRSGVLPAVAACRSRAVPLGAPLESVGGTAALWLAPQPATLAAELATLEGALAPDAALCALTGTRFGGMARRLRRRWLPGEPPAVGRQLGRQLAAGGWRVHATVRLGGAASLWWAVAGRLAAAAGRPDLADRAEAAHHLAAVGGRLATFELVLARRWR